jgi:hypothetical protein
MIHFLVKPSGLILFLVTSYKMSIRISMVVAHTRSELKIMQRWSHLQNQYRW